MAVLDPIDMLGDLTEALGGRRPKRPARPLEAWKALLDEVEQLRRDDAGRRLRAAMEGGDGGDE